MPYDRNDELPASVRNKYTAKQQRAFRKAYNDAAKKGKSESARFQIAHAAAQRAGDKAALETKDEDMSLLECEHEGCNRKFMDAAMLHDHAASVHTLSEKRSLVSKAVRTIHGRDSFLIDLSDDWLVYDVFEENSGYVLYRQSYELDNAGNVKLKGNPSEVVRKVSYIPAPKVETAESTLSSVGITFATDDAYESDDEKKKRKKRKKKKDDDDKAEVGDETAEVKASQTTVELSEAKGKTSKPHAFKAQDDNPSVCAVCNKSKGDKLHNNEG